MSGGKLVWVVSKLVSPGLGNTCMRRFCTAIFVTILCASFLGCGHSQTCFLRVDNLDTEEVLFDIPVKPGDEFYLNYIHSVSKTPILDTFQISSKGEIILVEEDFQWYGSGLEFVSHKGVCITHSKEGGSKVFLERCFPYLLLRVGWIGKQRLTFNGKVIPLLDIANGGDSLKIWITKDGRQ